MKTKFISQEGKIFFELKLNKVLNELEKEKIIEITPPRLTMVPSPLGVGERENYSCLIKYE